MSKSPFLAELLPFYVSGTAALHAAFAAYGSPQALLRGAAAAVKEARSGNRGTASPAQTKPETSADLSAGGDPEVNALVSFGEQVCLMLDPNGMLSLYQSALAENRAGSPGLEHDHVIQLPSGRMLKAYNTRLIDEETGDMAFKPTDSLFDYLTDHMLVNYIFGDDVRLEGFYKQGGALFIVISQPFVAGDHPLPEEIPSRLAKQGLALVDLKSPNEFYVHGGDAGTLIIKDVHADNVVLGSHTGLLHPIDIHFKFGGIKSRLAALRKLGLMGE